MHWLPEPPEGTAVALGFDGSDKSDWTCIRAETLDGYSFTPRFGDGSTLWNPAEHGGRVPRLEVSAAVGELFDRFDVSRLYCDPPLWQTEIEEWSLTHGDDRVVEWPTYRPAPIHEALERFLTDLIEERISFDGCPDTARQLRNAKAEFRKGGRYILTKPDRDRKIDAAMATVLAHEAAADARASGWGKKTDSRMFVL